MFYVVGKDVYVDIWDRDVQISEEMIDESNRIRYDPKTNLIKIRVDNGQATYLVTGHSVADRSYLTRLIQSTLIVKPLSIRPPSPVIDLNDEEAWRIAELDEEATIGDGSSQVE